MKSRSPGRPSGSWFGPADTLDLHRFTCDDAERTLEGFLDRRALAGSNGVLVIHGAKTLASVVARVVRAHPLVEGSEPDNPGATRVWLAPTSPRQGPGARGRR